MKPTMTKKITPLLLASIGIITGCFNSDKSVDSLAKDSYVGTWQLDMEEVSNDPLTIYLTPEQEIFAVSEEQGEDLVAYRLPLKKVSDSWQIPEGVAIIDVLDEYRNQGHKAIESEAKTYVGSINRAQQAYQLENSTFSRNIPNLNLGIRQETDNYSYSVLSSSEFQGVALGKAKNQDMVSYIGITALTEDDITVAVLCESAQPIDNIPNIADRRSKHAPLPSCPPGFTEL